jgi:hypothetical protein
VQPGVVAVALHGLPIIPAARRRRPAARTDTTLLRSSLEVSSAANPSSCRATRPSKQEEKRLALESELDRVTDLADDTMALDREDARPPAVPS